MYSLDSNVVVHYLSNALPRKSIAFINQFIDDSCYISVITQMETLGYNFKTQIDKNTTEIFIENTIVFDINIEVVVNLKKNTTDLTPTNLHNNAKNFNLFLFTTFLSCKFIWSI